MNMSTIRSKTDFIGALNPEAWDADSHTDTHIHFPARPNECSMSYGRTTPWLDVWRERP